MAPLSESDSIDIDDVLISRVSVPSLSQSATRKLRLKTTLAPGAVVSEKLALAVSGP